MNLQKNSLLNNNCFDYKLIQRDLKVNFINKYKFIKLFRTHHNVQSRYQL